MLRLFASVAFTKYMIKFSRFQFAVFKPPRYYLKETTGLDVKVLFAKPPMSRFINQVI